MKNKKDKLNEDSDNEIKKKPGRKRNIDKVTLPIKEID